MHSRLDEPVGGQIIIDVHNPTVDRVVKEAVDCLYEGYRVMHDPCVLEGDIGRSSVLRRENHIPPKKEVTDLKAKCTVCVGSPVHTRLRAIQHFVADERNGYFFGFQGRWARRRQIDIQRRVS